MTADLFLVCFLACLFAFVTFGVIAWQMGRYLLGRAIVKHLPALIRNTLHAMHGEGADGAAFNAAGLQIDPRQLDDLMKGIVRCTCDHAQLVPPETVLPTFLEPLGWRFNVPKGVWECPSCVGPTQAAE